MESKHVMLFKISMKKRKVVSVVLLAAMIGVMGLTGCGDTGSTDFVASGTGNHGSVSLPKEIDGKTIKAIGYDGCFKVKEAENERDLEKKFYKIVEGHLQSDEILEVLAHPGFIDDYALNCSSYNLQRIIEHKALTGSNIKKFLSDNNIDLINYNHLKSYFQR